MFIFYRHTNYHTPGYNCLLVTAKQRFHVVTKLSQVLHAPRRPPPTKKLTHTGIIFFEYLLSAQFPGPDIMRRYQIFSHTELV